MVCITERLTVRVQGRVQMVGYRLFTERTAARIGGITGTVRNLPDGASVAVTAEGTREALSAFLVELRIGPAQAIVRGVEVEWSAATGEFDSFTTIY